MFSAATGVSRWLFAGLVLAWVASAWGQQRGTNRGAHPEAVGRPESDEALDVLPTDDSVASSASPAEPTDLERLAITETTGRPPSYFHRLWDERRQALAAGDTVTAHARLATMLEAKKAAGWPDFFVHGQVLARQSRRQREQGQTDAAIRSAKSAVMLAPHAPTSHVALAFAHWDAGHTVRAIDASLAALRVAWREPPSRQRCIATLLFLGSVGLIGALVLFGLVAIGRYYRVLLHDLAHLMPKGRAAWKPTLVAVAVLSAPVLLRLGILWWVVLWLSVLGMYFNKAERLAGIVAMLLLAAGPVFLPQLAMHFSYPGSRSHQLYLGARSLEAFGPAEELEWRRKRGSDADVLFVLGLRAHWSGDFVQAHRDLEAAVEVGGNAPELWTTLGSIRYWLGDSVGAIKAFDKALAGAPDYVVALFNKSRVHHALAEYKEATMAHRRATAIDMQRVERYSREAKREGRSFLVQEAVPWRLLAQPVTLSFDVQEAVDQVWSWLAGAVRPMTFVLATVVGVFILLLGALLRGPFSLSTVCGRCGLPACVRCDPSVRKSGVCGPCYGAFEKSNNGNPSLRVQQEIEVHRYQASRKRQIRLLAVLFAGGAHFIRGATLRGVLLAAIFVACLVGLLEAVGWLPSQGLMSSRPGALLGFVAFGVGALFTYVLGFWDGVRGS